MSKHFYSDLNPGTNPFQLMADRLNPEDAFMNEDTDSVYAPNISHGLGSSFLPNPQFSTSFMRQFEIQQWLLYLRRLINGTQQESNMANSSINSVYRDF